MSVFQRRFDSFPTIETLSEIEAINVIDLVPPAPSTGAGSGAVLVVGEYEAGFRARGRWSWALARDRGES